MTTYRILAKSLIHPGNHLVETPDGACYIFFADMGELCATTLDRSFAEAMIQSYEWSAIYDDEWLTLDELQTRAMQPVLRGGHEVDIAQPET